MTAQFLGSQNFVVIYKYWLYSPKYTSNSYTSLTSFFTGNLPTIYFCEREDFVSELFPTSLTI